MVKNMTNRTNDEYDFNISLLNGEPLATSAIKAGLQAAIVQWKSDDDIEYSLCWYNPKKSALVNYFFIKEEENDKKVIELLHTAPFRDFRETHVFVESQEENPVLYENVARKIRAIKKMIRAELSADNLNTRVGKLESKIVAMEQLLLAVVNAVNTKDRPIYRRLPEKDHHKRKITPL